VQNSFSGKIGPLLIAEIGGNHEGDFEYAKKLVKLAISCDVDYIKLQLYRADTLVNKFENPDGNKHFKKFELSKKQHIELAKLIKAHKIDYMASIWDRDMIDWVDKFMQVYKIGSGDLTNFPLIKEIVKKGKPVILSTGLATEEEILKTVKYIQSIDSKYKDTDNLAILQCTSMYPIAISDANLNVISRLKELTGLTIGYSDHTEGMMALCYAFALGAQILEFHFTDCREGKSFRDHKVSLTPEEVNELKKEIKLIKSLRGEKIKKPLPIEVKNNHHVSFRRAVYAKHDIAAGTTLSKNDLITLRPKHGIDACDFDKLIGRVTKIDIKAYSKLSWEFFD